VITAAAYGFSIEGLPETPWLALEEAEGWARVTFNRLPALGDEVRADVATLRVDVGEPLDADRIIHPVLAYAALELAVPRGIDAMHAGAILVDGRAWGIVGTKESGKSTLLAAAAASGITVLSDDVLVTEGARRCLAGPRCIDLRPESARHLGGGAPVRDSTRTRVTLPPAPAEAPLAGLVHLAWGERTEAVPLAPTQRLAPLAVRRAEDRWPRAGHVPLELAQLPAFELRRPRRWDQLARSVDVLAAALA
jgi:hypothetical protein